MVKYNFNQNIHMKNIVSTFIMILLLSSSIFALSVAKTSVYVPDQPKITNLEIKYQDGYLCTWDIADDDPADQQDIFVEWTNTDRVVSKQSPQCSQECYSYFRTDEIAEHTCEVTVTDSFGLSDKQSISYTVSPTGYFLAGESFLSRIVEAIMSFFS
jgi:hypothetical protein